MQFNRLSWPRSHRTPAPTGRPLTSLANWPAPWAVGRFRCFRPMHRSRNMNKRARPQVVDIIVLTCRTMPENANGILAGCIARLKPFTRLSAVQYCFGSPLHGLWCLCTYSIVSKLYAQCSASVLTAECIREATSGLIFSGTRR